MNWWRNRSRGQKIGIGGVGALVVIASLAGGTGDGGDSTDSATAADATTTTAPETSADATTLAPPTTEMTAATTATTATTATSAAPTTTTTTTTTQPPQEPMVIEGSGNDVVDIDKPEEPMIVTITGNDASRFFAVRNYGANGERISGIVSTTDVYSGTRPLDWVTGEWTTRFEVEAVGAWRIEVLPLTAARKATAPGTFEGTGDDVVFVSGGPLDTALITGNPEGRFWAVRAYGSSRDSIVSTTDPFEGRVIVPSDTVAFEIEGSEAGAWSITME